MKRYSFIILMVILASYPPLFADVTTTFADPSITFEFDKPKGTVTSFDVNRSIVFYNFDPDSPPSFSISNLQATITGISDLTATFAQDSESIAANSSEGINLIFTASSGMAEGIYTGSVEVTGTGVTTRSFTNLIVQVKYPPATLQTEWEGGSDWGNLKAGDVINKTLKVSEVMGYSDAQNVSLIIEKSGPISISYTGDIGELLPSTLSNVNLEVRIPEKGLIPAIYSIHPKITADEGTTITTQDASYTLPQPGMVIDTTIIDFGQITFETDKDYAHRTIEVKETGGYTPIEGFDIELTDGPEEWITYTSEDYIPPGSSTSLVFTIHLPQEASLGEKSWNYKFDTFYAGDQIISARTMVYYPGIEDALVFFEEMDTIDNYPDSGTVIKETLDLLEKGKEKTEIKKIAMVMSIYGGARSLLNHVETAATNMGLGDLTKAGDAVISGYDSLNKILIGNTNIEDAELKLHSGTTETAAISLWTSAARDVLGSLEGALAGDPDYKTMAFYYKRLSKIHSLLGDEEASAIFKTKQEDVEKTYTETLSQASSLKTESDMTIRQAQNLMYGLEDTYIVLNPLNYDRVSLLYTEAIQKELEASELYKKAGEGRDANLLKEHVNYLEDQKGAIDIMFTTYGLAWTLVFIWVITRISLGLQRFRQDSINGLMGDVVVGSRDLKEREP